MTTTIKIFGVKEALKELNQIDRNLRKDINARAKDIAKPAVDGIKNSYPEKYLSGMARNWTQRGRPKFPYDQAAARKGVQLKIDTSKKNVSVIRIQQMNPAAAIIDMAGKQGGRGPQGGRFVDVLTNMFGQPSRVMWPGYEKHGTDLVRNMTKVVEDLMQQVNKNLVM
jgi:hypothetical protein